MNNFEKIKQMDLREMAIFLTQIHCKECGYPTNWEDCEQDGCWCHANNDYQSYGEWLLQEVEEMSYSFETEQDEVLEYVEDYYVDCLYCNEENIEHINICSMPWGTDGELRIECPNCKKNFKIRPKYKFEGFFIYSDDEQMEESEVNND